MPLRARRRRTIVGAIAICGAAVLAAVGHAQAPAARAAEGLTLADVLQSTLRDNPDVQIAARGIEVKRGTLVTAIDPFDSKVQLSVGNNRFNTSQSGAGGSRNWLTTNQTAYTVGVERYLRRGIVLSPELSVSRTALPSVGIQPASQATARLNVRIPLARDRGGVVTGAGERSAEHSYDASKLDAHHVTAQAVLSAVTAYWEYKAATTRSIVLIESEQRAERLLADTQRLVDGGERPQADLTQAQGNLAAKRITRIQAEQVVIDTRVRLGIVMGLAAGDTAALAPAATPFPAVDGEAAQAVVTPVVIDRALAARPDLRATEQRAAAARVTIGAAQDDLKPRFDLVSSVGYAGLQVGGAGLPSLFSSVYSNVPGPDVSIAFRYQRGAANSAARGRLLESEAIYEQVRIAQQDLQRRIRTSIYQASEAIGRQASAIAAAQESVAFYQATVRSEESKFQAGMSTLFDVILAAEALTNVRLLRIAAERDHAVALATLRFQTGTLVRSDTKGASVDVGLLVQLR